MTREATPAAKASAAAEEVLQKCPGSRPPGTAEAVAALVAKGVAELSKRDPGYGYVGLSAKNCGWAEAKDGVPRLTGRKQGICKRVHALLPSCLFPVAYLVSSEGHDVLHLSMFCLLACLISQGWGQTGTVCFDVPHLSLLCLLARLNNLRWGRVGSV